MEFFGSGEIYMPKEVETEFDSLAKIEELQNIVNALENISSEGNQIREELDEIYEEIKQNDGKITQEQLTNVINMIQYLGALTSHFRGLDKAKFLEILAQNERYFTNPAITQYVLDKEKRENYPN